MNDAKVLARLYLSLGEYKLSLFMDYVRAFAMSDVSDIICCVMKSISEPERQKIQLKYLFNSRAEKSCLDRMMEQLIVSDAQFVYAEEQDDDADIHEGSYSVVSRLDTEEEQKLISDLFVDQFECPTESEVLERRAIVGRILSGLFKVQAEQDDT